MSNRTLNQGRIMMVMLLAATWGCADGGAATAGDGGGLFVKVQPVFGVPTFTISRDPSKGYEPFTTPCFETYVPQQKYFEQFAQTGIRLYSFNTNAAECDYGHSLPTWLDVDTWDYGNFDERMQRVLRADPDAMVMPRINLGTPRWWLDAHPEEWEILDHGSAFYNQPNRNPTLPQGRAFPSVASRKWREDTGRALQKFLEHVENAGYNKHIFGYFLAGLDTEEWYHWSSGSNQLLGYSSHMQAAFQQWLRRKYVDVATLRRAWNRPDITFETVVVPSRAERFDLGEGSLRDPAVKMNVIDFYTFYNHIVPETIDYFAGIVKRATNRAKAVGAFYGYMYEFRGDPEYGHNALEQYNDSTNLDFIFVTASYGNRQMGAGGDYSRAPAYSVQLHGKLWYHDNDVCSFLAPKVLYATNMPEDDEGLNNIRNTLKVLGYVDTAEKTIWMYRRAMGFALCSGAYESYFDLHGGYYDDPELMREVGRLNRVAEVAARYDRSSSSEILVVSDETSCSYATFRSDLLEVSLYETQHQLIKIGAPADHVLINDLDRLDTSDYKLVIFLNSYNMTDRQRLLVEKKLKHSGKTLMWCYAPGYFNGNRSGDELMASLTGFAITREKSNSLTAPQISLQGGSEPLQKALQATALKSVGSERKCSDVFYVDKADRGVEVAGTLAGTDRAVLAAKDMGGWRSIYCLTPMLPPAAYRAIARYAGVHIFNDCDDTLYANTSYVTIHANGPGERTIRFPWACDIIDAVSEKPLGVNTDQLTYDFEDGQTLILRWKVRL